MHPDFSLRVQPSLVSQSTGLARESRRYCLNVCVILFYAFGPIKHISIMNTLNAETLFAIYYAPVIRQRAVLSVQKMKKRFKRFALVNRVEFWYNVYVQMFGSVGASTGDQFPAATGAALSTYIRGGYCEYQLHSSRGSAGYVHAADL